MRIHTIKEPRNRRTFLHVGGLTLVTEVGWPAYAIGFDVTLDGDNRGVSFCVQLGVFLSVALHGIMPASLAKRMSYQKRETGIRWFEGGLSLRLMTERWNGRALHLPIVDWLFGRRSYSSTPISRWSAHVPMPERSYPATITLTRDTWKRPRWFPRTVQRADIDMLEPIPFMGKGESEWDCGEDAMHGLTTPADSVAQAIARATESVMRTRLRHGTPARFADYMPRKVEIQTTELNQPNVQ